MRTAFFRTSLTPPQPGPALAANDQQPRRAPRRADQLVPVGADIIGPPAVPTTTRATAILDASLARTRAHLLGVEE